MSYCVCLFVFCLCWFVVLVYMRVCAGVYVLRFVVCLRVVCFVVSLCFIGGRFAFGCG